MVDDSMEISSDHSHHHEQGDIDIDFDLTTGPGDEDFILEDATSHVDFGNELHTQISAPVNDDIMVDDDNESFQMEDAEILDGDTEHIEQESMNYTADGDASYAGVIRETGDQYLAEDTNGISYEDYDATNDGPLGFNLQQDAELAVPENVQDTDKPLSMSTDGPTQGTPAPGSQASNSCRHSLPPAPTEPRSPPTSVVELGLSPSHISNDHTDTKSTHEADNSGSSQSNSNLQDVVVVYRKVEYALFSTSENDDPDLYFLSDMSIAEKPLSEFFTAIREVIRGDLVDEDELCIVVDSLGLQAEETSQVVEDVTLLQVLNLHDKLSENDGPEYFGACHIFLKTRTSFARRFSNLAAGAAEGKGLSEFAYWDDLSIGLDDSENPEESKYDFESIVEGQEPEVAAEDYVRQEQYEHTASNGLGKDHAAEEDTQNTLQNPDNEAEAEAGNAQHTVLPEVDRARDDYSVSRPNSAAPNLLQKVQHRDSDVDEDGDLIDYSEDEEVVIEKPKVTARRTDRDEAATEEFEKRDEPLRRRSLGRRQSSPGDNPEEEEELEATELEHQQLNNTGETSFPTVDGLESPTHSIGKDEYTDHNGSGHEQFPHQGSGDLGKSDYDQFNADHPEYGEGQREHDGVASVEVVQDNTENDDNNAILEQYGEGEAHAGADLDYDHSAEQSSKDENAVNFENDEIDFEIGDISFPDEAKHRNDLLELDETDGNFGPQDTSKASSLDVTETTDSSITMIADEIQYEDDDLLEETCDVAKFGEYGATPIPVTTLQQKDEIDYEDDEEDVDLTLQSPTLVSEVQGSQNTNGKRSIADVELNDAQTLQTNDAKRPRS